VASLKERLPPIFERLVRDNLPALRAQAEGKLARADRGIRLLGNHALSPVEMTTRAQSALRAKSPSFTECATPALTKFREAVHATLSEEVITKNLVSRHFAFDAFTAPFFQGANAFEAVMLELGETSNHFSVLVFTRYCFTSKLYCGSQSFSYCSPPPALPALL